MLSENKISKYLLYAAGEIVLVVIGILIALQINNNNDLKKARNKELHYLENIKTDLLVNNAELDNYIATRNACIEGASRILNYFEGAPVADYDALNDDCVRIYTWQKFYQNNNTFQELINSGNLALFTNDTIKNLLLDIESLYKKMKSEEDHFRFDTEELIFGPLYEMLDLSPFVNNYDFRASQGQSGRNTVLTEAHYVDFFKSKKLKNGFQMTIIEFSTMNGQMIKMKNLSDQLIAAIDRESQR